jgi:hypothetical protein
MRNIEKKLVEWLDVKLSLNGYAQKAIENKDARTLFRLAAESCVGIKESSNNSGTMVELFQETIGSANKEAWCMAFIQSCLAYAERKTGVKSPIAATEHCMTCWNESPKSCRVKKIPAPGAIIIWRHGAGPAGHTGVMLEYMNTKMATCEGNTSDSNMREGDCVALKTRSTTATGKMRVIGYLKPF